jgi:hypothetical protein
MHSVLSNKIPFFMSYPVLPNLVLELPEAQTAFLRLSKRVSTQDVIRIRCSHCKGPSVENSTPFVSVENRTVANFYSASNNPL